MTTNAQAAPVRSVEEEVRESLNRAPAPFDYPTNKYQWAVRKVRAERMLREGELHSNHHEQTFHGESPVGPLMVWLKEMESIAANLGAGLSVYGSDDDIIAYFTKHRLFTTEEKATAQEWLLANPEFTIDTREHWPNMRP